MPGIPTYRIIGTKQAKIGTTVDRDMLHEIRCHDRFTISEKDALSVLRNGKALWIYGYVDYRDFLGGVWRSKYCATLIKDSGGLRFGETNVSPSYVGRGRRSPEEPDQDEYALA
jgi:hypothetical protein